MQLLQILLAVTHVSSSISVSVLFADPFNQPLNLLFLLVVDSGDKILPNIVSIACLPSH
jgi:hypothetical protein